MEYKEGLDKGDIKVANRQMVLALLDENQPLSRIMLAKITQMSPTSMTRMILELTELGLVIPVDSPYSGIGRKSTMLAINPEAYYILGLNITEVAVSFCMMNARMESVYTISELHGLKRGVSAEELAYFCYHLYQRFQKQILDNKPTFPFEIVKHIGISFPGTVDSIKQYVLSAPCFAWHEERTLCPLIKKLFQLPIVIENDIKASMINEYYRYPQQRADTMAFLTLDYGVGCAVMHNGTLLRGFNSGAGEIAHIRIPDNLKSPTKSEYLYYGYLFYDHILEIAEEKGLKAGSIKEIVQHYAQKHPIAVMMIESISHYLASLFSLIICAYNPEKIILGGAVLHEAPILKDLALAQAEYYYHDIAKNIQINFTCETRDEALLGGALIALKQYRDDLVLQSFR